MRPVVKKRITILIVIGTVAVMLVAVCAAAIFMAGRYVPTWYAPTLADPAQHQNIRDEAHIYIATFNNQMQHDEPFTYEISEAQINRFLTAPDAIDPTWQADNGPVSDPYVSVVDGALLLGATIDTPALQGVLNARLRPINSSNGTDIAIEYLRFGRMPVKVSWLTDRFGDALASEGSFDVNTLLRDNGKKIVLPERIPFRGSDYDVHIRSIECVEGLLRIAIDPVAR